MAKRPAVEIPVRLKKDQATNDLKTFQKDMVKTFAKVAGAVAVAKVAFDAVSATIGKVYSLTKDAVKLTVVQEKAERDLAAAIQLRQSFTDKERKSLAAFNSEVQQATAIGDESLLGLQKQLVLQGVEKDQLEQITKAVIGLAQVKGTGLKEAATVVTRVTRGEVGALKESGIVVKSVTEGIDRLVSMYSIAAAETQSFGGQVDLLSANFGDLMEEWGRTVTESPEMVAMFKEANAAVLAFARTITENKDMIKAFWNEFAGWIRDFVRDSDIGIVVMSLNQLSKVMNRQVDEIVQARAKVWRMDLQVPVGVADLGAPPLAPKGKTTTPEEKRAAMDRERKRIARLKEWMVSLTKTLKAKDSRNRAAAERAKELSQALQNQETAQNELRFQAELTAFDKRQALKDRELQATAQFYDNLKVIGLSGLSSMISGLVAAGLSGEKSLSEVMGSMFGGILSQVGQMMISLGTAAFIAASATAPIPLLWPIFGGKIGMAGALGLIGAGSVLTGVGQYMSSTAGGAKAEMGKAQGTAARMAPGSAADTGRASSPTERTTTTYNINFNGALPGSERRIAKEVRRILDGNFSPAGAY